MSGLSGSLAGTVSWRLAQAGQRCDDVVKKALASCAVGKNTTNWVIWGAGPLDPAAVLSSFTVSSVLSFLEPVTPSALSTSAKVSKKPGSAACATGAFDAVV